MRKGGLKSHNESVHKDISYYCDMCGFPATKKNKLKRHMETVHGDEDFNVTSVISQQHKRKNLGVEKKISINILKINFMHFYWCDWLMCLNHCKQNMHIEPPNMGMR